MIQKLERSKIAGGRGAARKRPLKPQPHAIRMPSRRKRGPIPPAPIAIEEEEGDSDSSRFSPGEDHHDEPYSDTSFPMPSIPSRKRSRRQPAPSPASARRSSRELNRLAVVAAAAAAQDENDEGIRSLPRATLRLGEDLENHKQIMELEKQRVELEKSLEIQRKQNQIMELEKQNMELASSLEIQRKHMQIMELEKKRIELAKLLEIQKMNTLAHSHYQFTEVEEEEEPIDRIGDDQGVIHLSPAEILPETDAHIHCAAADVEEHDPALPRNGNRGFQADFVVCQPGDLSRRLPVIAKRYRKEHNEKWMKAERRFQTQKDICIARIHAAKAELVARYGDVPPPKKGRSGTIVTNLVPVRGKRVVIKWNDLGEPVGEWGKSFTNFLGCMAKRSDYFNLAFTSPEQSFENLERTWRKIERSYVLDENPEAWEYVFKKKIPEMLKSWRKEVKKKFFTQIMEDWERFWKLDERVDCIQFAACLSYWESPEAVKQAARNIDNRRASRYDHHAGSLSYSQHAHRLEINEGKKGIVPLLSRTLGTFSKAYDKGEKKQKNLQLLEAMTKSVQDTVVRSQGGSSKPYVLSREEEDACIEQVFGPRKRGQYRARGVGATRNLQLSDEASSAGNGTHRSPVHRDEIDTMQQTLQKVMQQQENLQKQHEEQMNAVRGFMTTQLAPEVQSAFMQWMSMTSSQLVSTTSSATTPGHRDKRLSRVARQGRRLRSP